MTPSVSVVLPVLIRNNKQLAMTMQCLDKARRYTSIPFELVIVETKTQYLLDEADVYVYEKNVEPSAEKSHNRGFKIASGEYITLLTNDVYVSDGWLEAMLECFKIKDCGASTVASTQFNHLKENKIEVGNWWSTCMIKREVFDRVGYYDERFRDSWCDTDLLLRMALNGYKMYRNFNCVVDHLIGQTNYVKPGFKENYEAGRELFRQKHEGCGLEMYSTLLG
jgi:GT2 family glycosyltransferase